MSVIGLKHFIASPQQNVMLFPSVQIQDESLLFVCSSSEKKQEAEAKKKAAQAKQKLEKSGEDETPPSPSAAPKAKSKKAGSKLKATNTKYGGDSGAGSAGAVEDSDLECSD